MKRISLAKKRWHHIPYHTSNYIKYWSGWPASNIKRTYSMVMKNVEGIGVYHILISNESVTENIQLFYNGREFNPLYSIPRYNPNHRLYV